MTITGRPRRAQTEPGRRPALRLVEPAKVSTGKARRPPRPGGLGAAELRAQELARAEAAARDVSVMIGITVALCCLGLVMVLSASAIASLSQYGTIWGIFERQLMWMGIGAVALLAGSRLNPRFWRRMHLPLMAVSLFLLVAVLVNGVGQVAGGSSRWIGSGEFRIQPSELMKLAMAVYAADLVARRQRPGAGAGRQWQMMMRPLLFVLASAVILIYKQPDLGTAVVVSCIAFSILYAGGVRLRLLAVVGGLAALAGTIAVALSPYQRSRLLGFTNPIAHASGTGYQLVQALGALSAGSLTGSGPGTSTVKWGYLPNAHTDFIFAVVGNELGVLGAVAVIVLFGFFAWFGMRIASRTRDRFGSLLAVGITCWVLSEAAINIGGVIGVLPVTGIPLPFVSFGGSSLVVVMLATGILIGIARRTESKARLEASRR